MLPPGRLEEEASRLPAGNIVGSGNIISQAVTHSLVLLKMGVIIARNMLR
jgi:hypothetical protein